MNAIALDSEAVRQAFAARGIVALKGDGPPNIQKSRLFCSSSGAAAPRSTCSMAARVNPYPAAAPYAQRACSTRSAKSDPKGEDHGSVRCDHRDNRRSGGRSSDRSCHCDRPDRHREAGAPAPTFSASDITGRTISLGDYAGKIVILEWTNRRLPVCRQALRQRQHASAAAQVHRRGRCLADQVRVLGAG